MLEAARNRIEAPEDEPEDQGSLDLPDSARKEYRVALTGAKCTLQNARSLINEYCQKLPSDRWHLPSFSANPSTVITQDTLLTQEYAEAVPPSTFAGSYYTQRTV